MTSSTTRAALGPLLKHIEQDKSQFLSATRRRIRAHVSAKSPFACFKLITERNGRTATWSPGDGPAYVMRLIAYLRKRPYREGGNEYHVDSVLTGEILNLVTDEFAKVVTRHQEAIADVAVAELLVGEVTRTRFVEALLRASGSRAASAHVKSLLGATLMEAMRPKLHALSASAASSLGDRAADVLASASKSTVLTTTAHLVAKLASSAVGHMLIRKLSVMLAHSLGPLIVKLLAMPAVKLALKKLIFSAVVATLAKFVAAKLGMSLSTALSVVLIPVLLAWLAKDISELPEKLGVELSDAVCSELSASYHASVEALVTQLIVNLSSDSAVERLTQALLNDADVAKHVAKLVDLAIAS